MNAALPRIDQGGERWLDDEPAYIDVSLMSDEALHALCFAPDVQETEQPGID